MKNLTRQHIQDWLDGNKQNSNWRKDFVEWLEGNVEGSQIGSDIRTPKRDIELILTTLPEYRLPNA